MTAKPEVAFRVKRVLGWYQVQVKYRKDNGKWSAYALADFSNYNTERDAKEALITVKKNWK